MYKIKWKWIDYDKYTIKYFRMDRKVEYLWILKQYVQQYSYLKLILWFFVNKYALTK